MPNTTFPALAGLTGYPLIAVICCLLLLEEIGVPLPTGPGDLLVLLAGVTITSSGLSPILVALPMSLSIVAGGLIGREVFNRVGGRALGRLARVLRLSGQVDRLSARLSAGGSPAVFLGRITPGLRVITTQVSGLSGMPRRTFLRGLLPAVAVYESGYLVIGATCGPRVLSIVHRHTPPAWVLVSALAVAVVVALAVCAHGARVRRRPLQAAGKSASHQGRGGIATNPVLTSPFSSQPPSWTRKWCRRQSRTRLARTVSPAFAQCLRWWPSQ